MLSLISSVKKPNTHRVCTNKEVLFAVLNKIYDDCVAKGCDHFDIVIDTNINYEQEDEL